MKKISLIVILALFGFALNSCDPSNEDYEVTSKQNFTQCYAKVTDSHANHELFTVDSPVTIFLEVAYAARKCNITFSGLKKPDGTPYPSFKIEDATWKADDLNWGICEVSDPMVTAENGSADIPNISAFTFKWNNRDAFCEAAYTTNLTVCDFFFVIDGRYQVAGSRCEMINPGETYSSVDGGEPYKSAYPVYTLLLHFDTMTADLRITNAKFAASMTPVQMDMLGIPFNFKPYANEVEFEIESVVPKVNSLPDSDMVVTMLNGDINPDESGNISFNCAIGDVTYNVKANLATLAVPKI